MSWPSMRSLIRSWQFSLGAIVTLGLGIGISVAVFAATNRILLGSLPFAQPDRLVVIYEYRGGTRSVGVPSTFVERIRHAASFENITLVGIDSMTFRTRPGDDAKPLSFVRAAFPSLKTLGIVPLIGRDFTEEDAHQQRRLLMLSEDTWRADLGGRSDVIGQRLWLSDPTAPPFEVVAVLPHGFIAPQLFGGTPWHGIALGWETFDSSHTRAYSPPIARLKAGVSQAQAQSEIDTLVSLMQPDFQKEFRAPLQFQLEPLTDVLLDKYRTYAALVFAAAALVMLVACANMAALLMVRGRTRETRTAIQLALGASRRSLIVGLGLEALLLSGSACAIALVVVAGVQRAVFAWLPPSLSIYATAVLELRVIVAALVLTLLSTLLATVIPAWRTTAMDPLVLLQGRSGHNQNRLIGAGMLLTIEVALSTALAVGAVLTARTLSNVETSDVGFRPDGLYTVAAYLPQRPDRQVMLREYLEMLDVIRAAPGVQSAAGADSLPMIGIANRPMYGAAIGTQRCLVTDGLTEALGMRVIAGHALTADDIAQRAPVGVLSLSGLKFALPTVPPSEAIGRFLEFPGEEPRQVVGIVSDVQPQYLAPSMPTMYVPVGSERLGALLFAMRVRPGAVIDGPQLDRLFASRGLTPKPARVSPVSTAFEQSIINHQFRSRLFGSFGIIAVALAMVGIYAVLASMVAARRTELGIRVSLGATERDIAAMVVRDGARAAIPGICVGVVIAAWGGTLMESMLFGIHGRDINTFATVAVFIALAASLAAWLPARRASRVDPAQVVRRV